MDAAFIGLVVIILVALAFDYTNGFHDAANAIAVAVSTKALTPRVALALAAVMNLVGALHLDQGRQDRRRRDHRPPAGQRRSADRLRRADRRHHLEPDHLVVRAALVVVARAHRRAGRRRPGRGPLGAVDGDPRQGHHPDGALAAGRVRARLPVHAGILWAFRGANAPRPTAASGTRRSSAPATMALGHGMQDAQKTMGIITLALVTAGEIDTFEVPLWVVLASAPAISAGTYAGGFRIMRTLGRRIIQLTPAGGFAAQTVASGVMVDDRDRLRRPGVDDAHHHDLDHGRRRDPPALRGALGRRRQHRRRLGRHPAGRRRRGRGRLLPHPRRRRLTLRRDRRAAGGHAGRAGHRRRALAGAGHRARLGHGVPRRHRGQRRAARDRRRAGPSLAGLQWTINGYTLALAALILLGGSLGDRYGRRRVFLVGVVWFAVASLVCGLRPDHRLLVAARVLQGIGGALLTPGSLALIQSSFRPEDRARAIGAWSASAASPGWSGRSSAAAWSTRPAGGWCSCSTCRSRW